MRLLHTSDWHLGQYFYGKSRANEHQSFLTWLLKQATEVSADVILVAGDIFDTANPPSYAREMYFDFIAKVNQIGCQLIVVAGNHDSAAMLGESKQVLSHLNTHVVTHVEANKPENILIKNSLGDPLGVVCAIPFIRPRDVVKSVAGQNAQEKQRHLQQAIATHYQTCFEQAKTLISGNALPVVGTGHLTTVGASTSDSVRDIYIGTLDAFPADGFPNFDYLALGHIHQSQKVAKSERIRYCGSPIALSFDEAKQQKYVHLVDVDSQTCEVERIEVPTSQQLIMLNESVEDIKDQVLSVIASFDIPLDELKSRPVWLDIEVNSDEYHHDIAQRIDNHLSELPVEVLRVRRSKAQRIALMEKREKVVLEELDVSDVFNQRLAKEGDIDISTDVSAEQNKRMTVLYQQMVEKVQTQEES